MARGEGKDQWEEVRVWICGRRGCGSVGRGEGKDVEGEGVDQWEEARVWISERGQGCVGPRAWASCVEGLQVGWHGA